MAKFKDHIQEVLYMVERGKKSSFEELRLLNEATSFRGRIPKSFWRESGELLGMMESPKSEVRKKKEQVELALLERICKLRGSDMPDNVYRLLRAVSVLGIRKDDERLPKPDTNQIYAIAYYIWISDGEESEETFRMREASMMCTSETIKLLLKKLYEVT